MANPANMNIGLILIGDELLSGKRQDKHFPWVTKALADRGLELSWCHIIGDDEGALVELIARTMQSDDLVFSCGGIGATPDDRTRQAAARAAGLPLVRHPEAVAIMEARFGEALYPNRILMSEIAEGAGLIPNPVSKVPGFSIAHHHFVPGFPKMAWPMIDWVLDTHYSHIFPAEFAIEYGMRVHNVPESELLEIMQAVLAAHDGLKLSSLPDSETGLYVELSVKALPGVAAEAYRQLHAALIERNFELSDIRCPEADKKEWHE